ncbi:MAG: DUF6512 family protein [Actinomycetia bacterium]|nr:DUF6512 family protein [Actinomycetes bacterium]
MYIPTGRKTILKWEMYGILFMVLLGSFLHFIFELSGGLTAAALIGAVNESVWEHLKIGFWPAFIWAIIEFFVFGKRTRNFLLAKGTSITLIAFLITGIYYSSVALGIETLALDIGNFVVSIALSQVISYRIMLVQRNYRVLNMIGVVLIIINLTGFSLLSYYPPRCPLFKDPVTGGYGIVEHEH